jgi:hypothetical protein
MSAGTYQVVIREGGHWRHAELAGVHTHARSLPALDQAVQNVVGC